MKLTMARTLATAVALTSCVVAVTPAIANADPALLNGTYSGGDSQNVWTIATNCGADGCTGSVASNQGWTVPATLTAGRWAFTVTKPEGVICDDGSYAPAYISLSVDPVTLSGTLSSDSNYGCPGGDISQTPFQLTKVG